ncbi:MAG: ROK family transcriptional regulator [Tepidanaerobacteraceae bacterium]|nr:ROK family transcriptional regulator [Tepidanaerobacteraceae bacterium]
MCLLKEPGNSKYVKKLNRMAVINTIKEHEPLSRQQLAKITGLTPPAITGIIRELLDIDIVREVGLDKSRGGRRPVKLRFNPYAGYVIGVEVTRFESFIGTADLKNDPTDFQTFKLDMTEPETGIKQLAAAIKQVMNEKGYIQKNFLGVGVAFPGLLNVYEGTVKRSINLGNNWNNFPVKKTLERELELPVFIENNSNASALAERWFGGGTDCKDLVYVNLGEGISAGIMMNDRILQGAGGHAGEIGHMSIQEGGPLCNCGNRGCLESICGIPALVRRAKAELPVIPNDDALKKAWIHKGKISVEDIIESASIKESYSGELLKQMSVYVGKAIANVVNFYNPNIIFIGGKMAVAAEYFIDVIKNTVETYAFPEIALSTDIQVSSLKENSGVMGACALVLRYLFKSNSDMLEDVQQA